MSGLRLPPRAPGAQQKTMAPPSSPASPPPPHGTKRKWEDEGTCSSKKQKGNDSARQLRLLTEELFKLEERRDLVAAKYQDLPLRVRRDVRHQHANEQFVLAALLQPIHTPYAAAALPDAQAETPIAELCPRDENLLREAKLAVGEAAIMGEDLTLVFSQVVLKKIAAANDRLAMIEAMVTRLNRSYGESTTNISERAMVITWNLVCQRIQQGVDINGAIQYGRHFLVGWAALDGFVATKFEERRLFGYDTSSLFQASDRATETTDDESETESVREDDKKTEGTTSSAPPASSTSKPAADAPSKRTKVDPNTAYENWKRDYDAEEASRAKRRDAARRSQRQSQSGLFDTIFLPNYTPLPPTDTPQTVPQVAVGVPQASFEAYNAAWDKTGESCSNAELPLPLSSTDARSLRDELLNQLNDAYRSTPREDREKRGRIKTLHNKTRDQKYTDENIFKLRAEMFVADGVGADFKVEETGGQAAVKLYWDENKSLGKHQKEKDLKAHISKLEFLKTHFKKEWRRWHEDMLDRRTRCKHLEANQRTSRITMVKGIYNGIMSLKDQVDRAIKRGGQNERPEDNEHAWHPDPSPEG